MFRGIKYLYLINGKLVFRKHVRKNGQEKHIWKVIGSPDEFSEKELKEIVKNLLIKLSDKDSSEKNYEDRLLEEKLHKESNKKTLGHIIDKFLEWYKETRKFSSYCRYLKSSKAILRFFSSDIPIQNIDLGMIEEYKIWRKKENVTPATINKDLRFLATLINRAVEFKWIPGHELYRKPILIKGVRSHKERFLTEEEEKLLIRAIKNPLLKDIVIFALNTGLRKGEILNLTWDEINFNLKCIVLKAEKTKSGRKHILPLNQKAWEIVEQRFKERRKDCPYVFHRNGKKVKCIKEGFKNAVKRAGIEDLRFHDLRHTFASRLVQKGIDLYVVKELLNHADITTTQRYAHLKLDNMRKAVEVL